MMTPQQNKKDWYRLKRYPHIGLPLEARHRGWVEAYVTDKDKVASHSFSPFIHRKTTTRKFRKEVCHDGTRSVLRRPSTKERELYYSNHLDSNIYSFYSALLSEYYEQKIFQLGIHSCVTGYRRIPLNPSSTRVRNKCNVDFSNEVFSYIKDSQYSELVAITFDIKSFFDNLNHKKLKKYWRQIVPVFSDDHYNVFRNITNFSYVEENQLFDFFKNQIIVERQPSILKNKKVEKKTYLKNQRAVAFCRKSDLGIIRKQGLIKANKYTKNQSSELRQKGIPQGSPISSTLANIYMLEFDKAANDLLVCLGGMYRRYSDDMVVVCKAEHTTQVVDFFLSKIKDFDLEIQDSKTQIFLFRFDKSKNRYYCFEKNTKTGKLQTNTFLEYLGFQFDGKYTFLKSSSLAGYYRKMKRSFARAKFYMTYNKTSTKGELFKSRLYKKFTYRGAKRRRIYKRDKKDKSRFILSHRYDWGNYLTYANLAANIISDNKITQQTRKHWNKFHALMKKTIADSLQMRKAP